MTPTARTPLHPDAFNLFVARSGKVRTPATRRSLGNILHRLQRTHPRKAVSDFTTADLKDFCLEGLPSPNTQKARRTAMTMFFGWATFEGLCREDPSRDLKYLVQPGGHTVRRHNWLTPDEVQQLLTTMPRDTLQDRRDRMLVLVGLLTGLRSENLAALKWSEFSDDLTTIQVTTKGQKLKEFGVPEALRGALRLWRQELMPHQSHTDPVFFSFHYAWGAEHEVEMDPLWHKPLMYGGVRKAIMRVTKATVGIELRPHDLRRSYAGFLESKGYSINDIARALGHENIATTSRYMDKNPNRAVSVGRSLEVNLG